MSATLDRLLAGTRADIDKLRAESAAHARDAATIADQMTEPTDVLRAMEAEERDLAEKLRVLQGAIGNARAALDDMQAQHDQHVREAEDAANAAEYYQTTTLRDLAWLLDGVPPAEALAATGLMPRPFAWGCQVGDRIRLHWIDGKHNVGRVADIDGTVLRLESGEEAHAHLIERVEVLPPTEAEPAPYAEHVGHDVIVTTSTARMGGHLDDVTATALLFRVRLRDGFAEQEEIQLSDVQSVDPDRRELLRELTQEAVEAGTYGEPAPREPVATPPVPTAPAPLDDAAVLRALEAGDPLTTLGDRPAPVHHAAPRDATSTGRMRALGERIGIVHRDEPAGEQQGDDDA